MEKFSLAAMTGAFSIWAIKELWGIFRSDQKRNTEALMQNTLALMELKVEVGYLKVTLAGLPKMQKDINSAHVKIREMLAVQTGKVEADNDA